MRRVVVVGSVAHTVLLAPACDIILHCHPARSAPMLPSAPGSAPALSPPPGAHPVPALSGFSSAAGLDTSESGHARRHGSMPDRPLFYSGLPPRTCCKTFDVVTSSGASLSMILPANARVFLLISTRHMIIKVTHGSSTSIYIYIMRHRWAGVLLQPLSSRAGVARRSRPDRA